MFSACAINELPQCSPPIYIYMMDIIKIEKGAISRTSNPWDGQSTTIFLPWSTKIDKQKDKCNLLTRTECVL